MAGISNGSGGNGGLDEPMASINVTPLVDVMLVLLVIFMVTAPMLQQGVDVDLPKADTGSMKGSGEQIVVSIDRQGIVYIGAGNKVALNGLGKKLKAILSKRKPEDRKVYVRADRQVKYGRVIEVMATIYGAGIYQVGLVTEPSK